jgi:hypothetical protein
LKSILVERTTDVNALALALSNVDTVQDVTIGAGVSGEKCEMILKDLTTVKGKLSLILTDIVDTTQAFRKLTKVGELVVDQNVKLTTLAWPALLSVEGNVQVSGNNELLEVTGPLLQHVYGFLKFESLKALTYLGLQGLVSVSTRFSIIAVPLLGSVCQVGSTLDIAPDVGEFVVAGSPRLIRGDPTLLGGAGIALIAACGGVDVTISTEAEYMQLVQDHGKTLGIARAVGEILITWPDVVEAQLSELLGRVTVTNGGIIIDGCSRLETLELIFDDLLTVGGELRVTNNQKLGSVALPKLATVGSILSISRNGGVAQVALNSLMRVGAGFEITGEPSLRSTRQTSGFVLSRLTTVGWFRLSELGNVQEVEIPSVTTVLGSVTVETMSGLSLFSMDGVAEIGDAAVFKTNAALTSVSMVLLVAIGGALKFEALGSLGTVTMPNLASAGSVEITNCNSLETLCGLGSLTADTVAGDVEINQADALVQGPETLLTSGGVPFLPDNACPIDNTTDASDFFANFSDAYYNTTTIIPITEPICMQCCPIPAYSFTPAFFGFASAGAFVLGSIFGVVVTFCCMTHHHHEVIESDLKRTTNSELQNLANQGYRNSQIQLDTPYGLDGIASGAMVMGGNDFENDIIY